MNFKMIHENYNVSNLEASLSFYEKALGLKEKRRKTSEDFIKTFPICRTIESRQTE